MQASDLNGSTAIPVLADANSFDDHRSQVREAYCEAIDGLLSDIRDTVLLPVHQAQLVTDAVQFTVFLGILKIAEATMVDVTARKDLMQIYRPLHMLIDREVPKMLMEFVDAKKALG